jgi:SAM-dependent methyltransferase
MGFYRDHILPRGVDWVMRREEFREPRRRAAAGLAGEVLEIGFGSGLNLPFYPPEVERILAVDPATVGRRLAASRLRECPLPVEFIGLDGESLPIPDHSVDAVLTTWTLCSIPDVARALSEVRRVLRPGGALHFVEHGLSPEPGLARWQRRLTPLQRLWAGGCRLDLPIDDLVRSAGFSIGHLETFYLRGPRIAGWTFLGRAVSPPSDNARRYGEAR